MIIDVKALKNGVQEEVDAFQEELVALSDRIHGQPELAFQEHRAVAWLTSFLRRQGLEVEAEPGGLPTAFLARHGEGRPVIALLAEYDALPGIGHGCGHNLIAAGAAGAMVALRRAWPSPPGTVLLIGTPAEEGGGGKIILLERGCFREVDAALMFHPAGRTVLSREALAAMPLEMEFRGKAAHAASAPHEGINALEALLLTFNNINALRQHLKEEVRIHGIVTRGGKAPNVVPDLAEGQFLVRARTREYLKEVVEKVKNCARAGALATGAELFIREGLMYAERVDNRVLVELFAANLRALGEEPVEDNGGGMGSSDMGNVSLEVPAIHPYIGLGEEDGGVHRVEFARAAGSEAGRKAMLLGAKALAMTAVDLLADKNHLRRAREEFERLMAKRP